MRYLNIPKIKLTGVAGDSTVLMFSRIVTTVLSLVIAKLLSINFTLTQYGTYSQATLIQSTATAISILGLTDAVNYFYHKADSIEQKQNYIATIFVIQYVVGIICALSIMLLKESFVRYFSNEQLRQVIFFPRGFLLLVICFRCFRSFLWPLEKQRV